VAILDYGFGFGLASVAISDYGFGFGFPLLAIFWAFLGMFGHF
jgi:hypothetical protein